MLKLFLILLILMSFLKAHNLTKEKKVNYGDDITSQLRRARRLKWEKQEEVRQTQEIELLVNNIYYF